MTKLAAHLIPNHWGQEDEIQLSRWCPKSVKVIDRFDRVPQLFAISPKSLFVLRDHPLSEQKSDMTRDPEGTGRRHAEEWIRKLEQNNWWGVPKEQVIVLGINEPQDSAEWEPQTEEEYKRWKDETLHHADVLCRYAVPFCDGLAEHNVRTAALNLSVGHPSNFHVGKFGVPGTPPDWSLFERVHKAIQRGGHFLGLHEYWDHRGPMHNWGWWAGRYTQCPWDVPILLGECGIDEYVSDGDVPGDKRGWRAWLTSAQYVEQLRWYESRLQEDPRIHSAQVYTYDYSHPWSGFDIRGEVAAAMPPNDDFTHVYLPHVGPPGAGNPTPTKVPPLVHPIADPVLQKRITQKFGENPGNYTQFGLRGHNGVDWGVPTATPIRAVADGEAVEVLDDKDGYGQYIKLIHPWGHSLYAHLNFQAVRQGEKVKAGQVIGLSGNTGNSTGPHLHFAMRVHPYNRGDGFNGYTDPLPYLTPVSLPTSIDDADLLARIITAEAGGESLEGQVAVAQVALNRAKRPGWWGTTLREVLTKPYQFAKPADKATESARVIAELTIAGLTVSPVGTATHFHSGPAPDWASKLTFIRQVGGHFFYRED